MVRNIFESAKLLRDRRRNTHNGTGLAQAFAWAIPFWSLGGAPAGAFNDRHDSVSASGRHRATALVVRDRSGWRCWLGVGKAPRRGPSTSGLYRFHPRPSAYRDRSRLGHQLGVRSSCRSSSASSAARVTQVARTPADRVTCQRIYDYYTLVELSKGAATERWPAAGRGQLNRYRSNRDPG